VRTSFQTLNIPPKFTGLSTQLIFQCLRLPVSATDLAHSFYALAPPAYRAQLKAHDTTVVALTHAALQEDLSMPVLVEVVANVMVVQLSKLSGIPQSQLLHIYNIAKFVYEENRQQATMELARFLRALTPTLPTYPIVMRPVLQCFVECLVMTSGSNEHNLRQAAVDLLLAVNLMDQPIVRIFRPLLVGDTRAASFSGAFDAAAVARAAVGTLEVKFCMSQDQQNQLRSLAALLDGATAPLATIKLAFLPTVGAKTLIFSQAMGFYDDMVLMCKLKAEHVAPASCSASGIGSPLGKLASFAPMPLPGAPRDYPAAAARHRGVREALQAGDILAAWIADQWIALYALHTFQTALPEPLCDYDKFERLYGVPAQGFRLFRQGVEVVMMTIAHIVSRERLAEMAAKALLHAPDAALQAAWDAAAAEVARRRDRVAMIASQIKMAQGRIVTEARNKRRDAEARAASDLDELQREEDDANGAVAAAERARDAAVLAYRGLSEETAQILGAVNEVLDVLLKDQRWNAPGMVQFGVDFVHTFKDRLLGTVASASDAAQADILKIPAAPKPAARPPRRSPTTRWARG
jgi:hypothetical protein